jgi:hypothetical protein
MSAFHHLKVATKGQLGSHVEIQLNGEDIAGGVRALRIDMEAGDVNAATLELLAPTYEVDGEFQVYLPEETQAALKQLGWTPPEETS